MSITEACNEAGIKVQEDLELQRVLYMHYPAKFNKFFLEVLIDLGSEVNAMQTSFAKKLGLYICKTDVSTQKINGSRPETFGMVIALFQVDDKIGKFCFLEETFLLVEISIDVAFKVLFLIMNKVEVYFNNRNFR